LKAAVLRAYGAPLTIEDVEVGELAEERVTEVAVGDHVVGCMSLFCARSSTRRWRADGDRWWPGLRTPQAEPGRQHRSLG
jgi:hypothetical protein